MGCGSISPTIVAPDEYTVKKPTRRGFDTEDGNRRDANAKHRGQRRRSSGTEEWQQYESLRKDTDKLRRDSKKQGEQLPQSRGRKEGKRNNKGTQNISATDRGCAKLPELSPGKPSQLYRERPLWMELRPWGEDSPEMTMAKVELAVLKRIRHGNIVPLSEVISAQDVVVVHYIAPPCLSWPIGTMGTKERVKPDLIALHLRDILSGLQCLHMNAIAHRDLCLEACQLGQDGTVRLCGWGINHLLPGAHGPLGNVLFKPPEANMDLNIDVYLGDLWSLGVIVFFLAFGMFPFANSVASGKMKGKSYAEIAEMVRKELLEFPEGFGVPRELCALTEGLLQKAPECRLPLERVMENSWLLGSTTEATQSPPDAPLEPCLLSRYDGEYCRRCITVEDYRLAISLPGSTGSLPYAHKAWQFDPSGDPQPPSAPASRETEEVLRIGPLPVVHPEGTGTETMAGPHRCCNWVVPRRVLQGAYPSQGTELEVESALSGIVSSGVTQFVSLLTPQESKAYPAYNKLAQESLVKYIKQLKTMSGRNMTLHPIRCISFAMPPHDAPLDDPKEIAKQDAELIRLVDKLEKMMSNREVLYIHCDKGLGRSSVVSAVLLARLYGLSATDALSRVQLYANARADFGSTKQACTPSTLGQVMQIYRVLKKTSPAPPLLVRGSVDLRPRIWPQESLKDPQDSDEDLQAIRDDLLEEEEPSFTETSTAEQDAAPTLASKVDYYMSTNLGSFLDHLNE